MQENMLQSENQEIKEEVKKTIQQSNVWEKRRQELLEAKKDVSDALVSQLKSGRSGREIKDSMRTMADLVEYSSYQYFLQKDTEYKVARNKICNLEDICMKLGIDRTKQRKVSELIKEWNDMEYHFSANAYMAGMLDGFAILRSFDLID